MPEVSARLLRVAGAAGYVFFGIVAVTVVFDEANPAPAWLQVVGVAIGMALAGAAIRCTRIGISAEQGHLVIRNVARTHRIPLAEVSSFDVAWSMWHGGPALAVVTGPRPIVVTAYPITRIPAVARRRTAVVDRLNEWLATQRS